MINLAGIGRRFEAMNGFRVKVFFFARVNNIIEEPDADQCGVASVTGRSAVTAILDCT